MNEREIDMALLDGRGEMQTVAVASARSGPVAYLRVAELGAVLWLGPCETCEDPWTAADIHVYKSADGAWMDAGGGGGDWDWHGQEAPGEDSDSAFCLSTPLTDGRQVCLIPRYGPSGATLRPETDHQHDWPRW